ncbi:MAG: hypothetical protein M1490_03835 [Candidatus Bathyarchaeota archaeon]|nr:hypothetical protein [Candidatus Bathyarchaeota archaeon]
MTKAPATTTNFTEGIVTTLTNTLSALLKSKGAIALIIVIAIVAFAIGYLSGRPSGFHDTEPVLKKSLL